MTSISPPEVIALSRYCFQTADTLKGRCPHLQAHIDELAEGFSVAINALYEQVIEDPHNNHLSGEYFTIAEKIETFDLAAVRRKEFAMAQGEVLN